MRLTEHDIAYRECIAEGRRSAEKTLSEYRKIIADTEKERDEANARAESQWAGWIREEVARKAAEQALAAACREVEAMDAQLAAEDDRHALALAEQKETLNLQASIIAKLQMLNDEDKAALAEQEAAREKFEQMFAAAEQRIIELEEERAKIWQLYYEATKDEGVDW